ncbi:hypothetical protein KJB49_11175 [Staphylococcus chromogenes]|uniref:hypothetical protein n=1 Tax=Staphylococcus chromogenes TaxID=46126 RepID=UPI001F3A244C|nr:hypothetical protein [Staphylococcus chromogenes]MCE4971827.1 hypothetical protein [Staphylococcus chromogenes]
MQEVKTYVSRNFEDTTVNMLIPFSSIQDDMTFTSATSGTSSCNEQGINFIVDLDVFDQFEKLKLDLSNGFKLYLQDGEEIIPIKREEVIPPVSNTWTQA